MIISLFFFLVFFFMGGGLILFFFSTFNVFIMWFSLELMSWGLLPFFIFKKNLSMKESMMKYFIIQSMSSILFFLSCLMWEEVVFFSLPVGNFWEFFLIFSFFLKMGLFPFQGWLMEILSVSDFLMGFLLLGFQKIIPFFILLKLGVLFLMPGFLKIILFSGNFAFIMFTMINMNYVMILFGISGIYHFTILFFMMSIAGMGNQTFIYFFFYLFFFGSMCLFQQKFLLNSKLIIFSENLSLAFFSFLILSGLPPFFMFFLKSFFLYSMSFSISDLFILFLVGVISIYIFGFLGSFWESISNNSMIFSTNILILKQNWGISLQFLWLFFLFSGFLSVGMCLFF